MKIKVFDVNHSILCLVIAEEMQTLYIKYYTFHTLSGLFWHLCKSNKLLYNSTFTGRADNTMLWILSKHEKSTNKVVLAEWIKEE